MSCRRWARPRWPSSGPPPSGPARRHGRAKSGWTAGAARASTTRCRRSARRRPGRPATPARARRSRCWTPASTRRTRTSPTRSPGAQNFTDSDDRPTTSSGTARTSPRPSPAAAPRRRQVPGCRAGCQAAQRQGARRLRRRPGVVDHRRHGVGRGQRRRRGQHEPRRRVPERRHRPDVAGGQPAHRARPARCSWSPPATPARRESVGSPGAADAALTVGAVDRDDELAEFSSRGPRWGDGAIKPDITAPGVDIVAAKAAHGADRRPGRRRLRVAVRHLDGRPARRRRGGDPRRAAPGLGRGRSSRRR